MSDVCSIEGCERARQTRGYCGLHYQRWYRYGDANWQPATTPNVGKVCAVEECERDAVSRGWCTAHYNRWRMYGDPEVGGPIRTQTPIIKRKRCAWPEGCKKLERARGFCGPHYNRARHDADLEYLLPEEARAERCIVPDCEHPQYAKGFCRNHYQKKSYGKDPLKEAELPPMEYETFGGRLYALRASRGWALEDVAVRVGVTRQRISQLEKEAEPPQSKSIGRLARAFGVDASVLIANQLPSDIGGEIKAKRSPKPVVSRRLHLRCFWCGGVGELPLSPVDPHVGRWTTLCAYCRGSGAVYISPAPALPTEAGGESEEAG